MTFLFLLFHITLSTNIGLRANLPYLNYLTLQGAGSAFNSFLQAVYANLGRKCLKKSEHSAFVFNGRYFLNALVGRGTRPCSWKGSGGHDDSNQINVSAFAKLITTGGFPELGLQLLLWQKSEEPTIRSP